MAKEHEKEKSKHRRRAKGGGLTSKPKEKNPCAAVAAIDDEKDEGFKKGGHVERKRGGKVEGEKPEERMDKRARGGSLKSPFSSARRLTPPSGSKSAGHEGEGAKEVP